MGNKRLYLIDATAFCYRAFYALKGLSTSFGQPTNAIYGFVNMLNKILREEKPEYLAACFDVSRDTFRQKKFAEYKIQRQPMPEGLSGQIPLIKELVAAYGIPVFEKAGFEADDVIATLVKKAKAAGFKVTIVSSDKDILQLVDENTLVFSPYKDAGVIYDTAKVEERFGVAPKKISDIIALMGDDADNIPGASGIGEKTATELITNFGSVENLLKHTDTIKQDKLRQIIADNLEKIKLSRELAILDEDVDIDFDPQAAKTSGPDYKELFRIFKYLEFKKFLKSLPQEESKADVQELTELKDAELPEKLGRIEEIVLCGDNTERLGFYAKNRSFRVADPGKNLKDILSDAKIKKIGHDLKKIKIALAKDGLDLEGLFFDCMLAAYLLNPAKSDYGLGEIAWDYLGQAPGAQEPGLSQAVGLIVKLRPRLEEELKDKTLNGLFCDLEMPLTDVLARMELTGIKLDLELLRGLSRDIEKKLIKLNQDIYELSGTQFNLNSPKQLREILFERLKLPVVKRSKTGPSTDEEVLTKLSAQHKLPAFLLEYRQLTKLKNTYVDALPELVDKKTQRIHSSFNQTGTETGRLSSSNPNLQNIPVKTDIGKNIRKAIIAFSQKSELVSCDYSQVELRILAHLAHDEYLIAAFKKDEDIHRATAALIYGLEEKDITDKMRETAKRVNFGIVYGLTSYGLSRDLNIPVDEAQGFIDAYFARYPRVKEYIEAQIVKAKKEGFVTTLLGRRRYIPEINNKNQGIRQFAERQAVNTPIQGSAADLIKLAMVKIDTAIREKDLKSRMILQVHDELIFDVPKDESHELIELVRERMENVLKLDVPIRVDIKKGKNWLEMEPA